MYRQYGLIDAKAKLVYTTVNSPVTTPALAAVVMKHIIAFTQTLTPAAV